MANILIVGVGGQGTLLASRVLGNYAVLTGQDCKLSEVHGMSQRGGSVVTHVRVGNNILSPIVAVGDADIIIAFEKLEALRWRHYLKKDGMMVVNEQEIMPMPVITGAMEYPNDIKQKLQAVCKNTLFINAAELAHECGNVKVANVIMLGALAKNLGFKYEDIIEAVKMTVPARFLDINLMAIEKGFNAK